MTTLDPRLFQELTVLRLSPDAGQPELETALLRSNDPGVRQFLNQQLSRTEGIAENSAAIGHPLAKPGTTQNTGTYPGGYSPLSGSSSISSFQAIAPRFGTNLHSATTDDTDLPPDLLSILQSSDGQAPRFSQPETA
ncbi:MAG: hypothetical protein SFZ03_01700 [Candidatus Melainabacteria bacterium]|nr:hypothetical protein [Candidatus Melainabacteria bacterium]